MLRCCSAVNARVLLASGRSNSFVLCKRPAPSLQHTLLSRTRILNLQSLNQRNSFSVSSFVRQEVKKAENSDAVQRKQKKNGDWKDIKRLFAIAKPEAKSISGKANLLFVSNKEKSIWLYLIFCLSLAAIGLLVISSAVTMVMLMGHNRDFITGMLT